MFNVFDLGNKIKKTHFKLNEIQLIEGYHPIALRKQLWAFCTTDRH